MSYPTTSLDLEISFRIGLPISPSPTTRSFLFNNTKLESQYLGFKMELQNFKKKSDQTIYLGIDLEDKSHLNNLENNVFTLRNDSSNYEKLYTLMEWYGKTHIDFMFVDGWHSVNQVLREWKYWEKMIPNGVMAFHDTNYHPGPVVVLDAVDTDIFSVEYFGRGEPDWGVGVVQRLKV